MRTADDVLFAAIIGHADDAGMLRRCIEHHLGVGVQRIFVSLNKGDPASAAVVREFAGQDAVRGDVPERFAADPYDFFTAAVEVVGAWCAPDWVLFVDSDEFWLPASGRIGETRGLDRGDLFTVARYNAPPVRMADGSIVWAGTVDRTSAIYGDPRNVATGFALRPDANPPWITSKIGPKVLVRPQLVARVERGAHGVVATAPALRRCEAWDLLIVHLPFTTEARFRRKVDAIRDRLARYGHRMAPGHAFHWKRWLEVDAQGLTDDEFRRQVLDHRELESLRQAGILTSPAQLFAAWAGMASDG